MELCSGRGSGSITERDELIKDGFQIEELQVRSQYEKNSEIKAHIPPAPMPFTMQRKSIQYRAGSLLSVY